MTELTQFIEHLIAAHRAGGTYSPGTAIPEGVADAYRCHDALMEVLGPAGGYKLVRMAGGELAVAPIPQSRCFASGATVAVPERIGVELEVGFVVRTPLPDLEAANFRLRLVAAVRPTAMIELVAPRLTGPAAQAPFAKLADLQSSAGLVRGLELAEWDGSDFDAVEISMTCGDGAIAEGGARVPGGSALEALESAVRLLQPRGGLQPGQCLLTGTLHPLTFIEAGQGVEGSVSGLGGVSAALQGRGGPEPRPA